MSEIKYYHSNNTDEYIAVDMAVRDTNGGLLTEKAAAVDAAHTLDLSMNSSTYVVTATLKNKAGNILSTKSIDLPLETMVVSGSYDSTNKKVILTLKSGSTVEFSVADLIDGLASTSETGYSLSASGTSVNLLNKAGTVLSTITTQDTTYSLTQDSSDGHKITLTPSSGTAQTIMIPDNNTLNTAGSTDTSSKIFLIGATSQASNPQTYSQDTAYVGTDGCVYSGSQKTETSNNKVTSISSSSTDTQYPSAKAIYDMLPVVIR